MITTLKVQTGHLGARVPGGAAATAVPRRPRRQLPLVVMTG
jgi:hypothetical protein